ncbi:hypothetical protein H0H92_011508 [Tricholoma furcatifolium]|nr:hypothetical protein H0H92_011508 [Tricholoma furcatifolium]
MSGSELNKDKPGRSSLIELKNGKVQFKQKCISFEKQSETLQEIVRFREMLEGRIKRQDPPLIAIPDEHRPLIVKLAHESDKTLAALSKHIRQELLPTQDEDDAEDNVAVAEAALPLSAVEAAIKAVMQRNNYGLDGIAGGRAPAAVCVWRWEVKDQHRDWLPKNAREKAETRLAERIQAKQDLMAIFESLSQDVKDAMLDPKGLSKLPQKEPNTHEVSENKSTPSSKKHKKEDEENDLTLKSGASKPPRVPKAVDPVKAAKEQERLEKKVAKAEKEKKEKDAQDKSRSIMANFFSKPKASTWTPTKATSNVASSSSITSDFERSFKPFVLKKDTEIAPINWFQESRKRNRRSSPVKTQGDIILIEDDDDRDVEMSNPSSSVDNVASMSTRDHLHSVVSSLSLSNHKSRKPPSTRKQDPRLKTYNPLCVRDIVNKLSEAEVEGDDATVRSLLAQLNDRSVLPAKVLIFAEDSRPGYFGTWTRSSRIIGPRTPCAKDVLVFDYGYDSGEEWEEEAVGDAEDVVGEGDDEEDGDEADSDADSWLVDDDEDVGGVSLEDPERDPFDIPDLPSLPSKRKAEDGEKKTGKKRKIVVPLVPYAKGPCWETSIGQCESTLFDSYRIQMFNEDSKRESKVASSNRPVLSNDGVFAIPDLPDRLQSNGSNATTSSSSTASAALTKKAVVPKQPFPDQHLPFLLQKIASLQTGSINFLIEAIHRDLREHKVKKNMIEAKVREVGEKCKEKKFWIVKPGIQA